MGPGFESQRDHNFNSQGVKILSELTNWLEVSKKKKSSGCSVARYRVPIAIGKVLGSSPSGGKRTT